MGKAVVCRAFGPPESFALEEYDPGPPGPDEVRVAIKAAGVSFVDVLACTGKYQHPPMLPHIPGSEGSGIVEAVGERVTGLLPGDAALFSQSGGLFCTVNNFPAARVSALPAGLGLESAAVISANYQTGWYALADRGRARAGETLLVLGAAGGTGFAAIQVGKHLGLRVIASASSPEKRAVAKAGGADVVVASGADDWRTQVLEANDGKPVDLVFDPVGGDFTQLAFRTLGYGGRHLIVGFPAGVPALPTNLPLLKSASAVGVHLGDAMQRWPDKAASIRATVLDLAGKGVFSPAIDERFALTDYAAAMNAAYSGKAAGRIVLTME